MWRDSQHGSAQVVWSLMGFGQLSVVISLLSIMGAIVWRCDVDFLFVRFVVFHFQNSVFLVILKIILVLTWEASELLSLPALLLLHQQVELFSSTPASSSIITTSMGQSALPVSCPQGWLICTFITRNSSVLFRQGQGLLCLVLQSVRARASLVSFTFFFERNLFLPLIMLMCMGLRMPLW